MCRVKQLDAADYFALLSSCLKRQCASELKVLRFTVLDLLGMQVP